MKSKEEIVEIIRRYAGKLKEKGINLRDYMEDNWQPLLHEIKTQGLEIAA